jgi:hypothetical protein
MAKAKGRGAVKKAGSKQSGAKQPGEAEELRGRLAKALGLDEAEVQLRALRQMAAALGLSPERAPAVPASPPAPAALPRRLYLALDGRGLDGRGMPFEVIDLPCIVGSSRKASVWINSPRIETNHLRITQGDEGWVVEDLDTEHGTYFGGERIQQRVLRDGDELKLAGYLRVRAELR